MLIEMRELETMKTKAFIKKVEELGFEVERDCFYDEEHFDVTTGNKFIACVSKDCEHEFATIYSDFTKLSKRTKKKLFDLLVEFSSTPIAERED